MIRAAALGLAFAASALPAAAQDYYATTTAARHGNGYLPSSVVAGWEEEERFTVIAFAADGARATSASAATDWKATLITGPRAEADDDDEEDERYLDKQATNPAKRVRIGAPVPRIQRIYASTTCPAVMARMAALKPLATFEFDPPGFQGNKDGRNGDGREGYDLWMRVGGAELSKSAETEDSTLARWFAETLKAFAACHSK